MVAKEARVMSGLEHRYEVHKVNDVEGKHNDCRFFVLDPQHDQIARRALLMYAAEAEMSGYDELAQDIYAWLNEIYGMVK